MNKLVILLAVVLVFVGNNSVNAKAGENPAQFVDRCFYGTAWGWLGEGKIINFNKEMVTISEIYSCDVYEENAEILVHFIDADEDFKVDLTPTNLNFYNMDGELAMMFVSMY